MNNIEQKCKLVHEQMAKLVDDEKQLLHQVGLLQGEMKRLQKEERSIKILEINAIIKKYRQKLDESNKIEKELNGIRSNLQDFVRDNPDIDESIYHDIMKKFIIRMNKKTHSIDDNCDCFTWLYNFEFRGRSYNFEWYAGKEKKPDQDMLPTGEELEAAKALGISLEVRSKQYSKSYW